MKRIFYFLILLILGSSCQKSSENRAELQFRYIEEFCCGNLMILDGKTIEGYNPAHPDSLIYGVNLDDFINAQNLVFGDELLIDYELFTIPLPDDVVIDCKSICNRLTGIPINILSLEKL